jgi:ABC-2 type transport system ATP-binding protein
VLRIVFDYQISLFREINRLRVSLLEIKNITKQYDGHLALDDVSLQIPLGKTIALLGHNGAGKSTLLRILLQIISKSSGDILLNGQPVREDDIRRFGYLPEERGLYKGMKVLEQLVYFARLRGLSKQEATKNAKHWLKKLSLFEWADKTVIDLSKGMQQKVQFITAVIHNPDIIILDEPFSGFDPVNAKVFVSVILDLKAAGKTILFSSHQMEAVEDICDEIAILNKSKIVLQGTLEELKEKYATKKYVVEGVGRLLSNSLYKVIEQKQDYWLIEPLVDINKVIDYLNKNIELNSFRKEEPSLTDIFIDSFNLG